MESLERKAGLAFLTVNAIVKRARSYKDAKPTSTPSCPTVSPLLALPGELRNKIYQYYLIVGDEHDAEYRMRITTKGHLIIVTKRLELPSLLFVCRQVRTKAAPYWYVFNQFEVYLPYYDPTLYLTWTRHVDGPNCNPLARRVWFRVTGNPDWANLMKWCYAVWSGTPPCKASGTCRKLALARAAHKIAVMSREDSWEKCEKQLRVLRAVFAQIDNRWSG